MSDHAGRADAADGHRCAAQAGASAPSAAGLRIGARFRVLAAPEPVAAGPAECIDLVLGPGAFGSGEHETTASCLEIMEGLAGLRGAEVLDLGSGTGILAIAAVKLGAARATCVDTEARAVETARRNCERNGVTERVRHLHGDLGQVRGERFDVVLANLWADVLLAVAPELAAATSAGAHVLLSGILWEEAFDVRRRYEAAGFRVGQTRMLESYCTLLLERTNPG